MIDIKIKMARVESNEHSDLETTTIRIPTNESVQSNVVQINIYAIIGQMSQLSLRLIPYIYYTYSYANANPESMNNETFKMFLAYIIIGWILNITYNAFIFKAIIQNYGKYMDKAIWQYVKYKDLSIFPFYFLKHNIFIIVCLGIYFIRFLNMEPCSEFSDFNGPSDYNSCASMRIIGAITVGLLGFGLLFSIIGLCCIGCALRNGNTNNRPHILKNIMKFISTHIISTNSISSDTECSICQISVDEDKTMQWISLDCDHKYHATCISEWLKHNTTCPMCRKDFISPILEQDS
jgi:hypothetical protein